MLIRNLNTEHFLEEAAQDSSRSIDAFGNPRKSQTRNDCFLLKSPAFDIFHNLIQIFSSNHTLLCT